MWSKNKWLACWVIGLLVMMGTVQAQSPLPSPSQNDYVSVLISRVFPDTSLGTNGSGIAVSALYGWSIKDRLALEFSLSDSIFETGVIGGTDFYQQALAVDLVYNFGVARGSRWTPFVLAGAGIANDDLFPNTRDSVNWIADAGVGITSPPLFKHGLLARLEVRYLHDSLEQGYAEPRLSLGVEIPLGGAGRRERLAEYRPAREVQMHEVIKEVVRPWRDADGDGVTNQVVRSAP